MAQRPLSLVGLPVDAWQDPAGRAVAAAVARGPHMPHT